MPEPKIGYNPVMWHHNVLAITHDAYLTYLQELPATRANAISLQKVKVSFLFTL